MKTDQKDLSSMSSHAGLDLPPIATKLRFNILGSLEVFRDGVVCTPTAPKQRALLALLLLHGNELLPTHRIIDELWGRRPPTTAQATLQMYVTAVRRTLTPGERCGVRDHPLLRTQPSGYVLQLRPGQLDLTEFRELAATGRAALAAGRCDQAGDLFRRALAMWRGDALADLHTMGALSDYVVRLEEERLALLQERLAVDLCQGRGNEVVGELEELCARHPLWERLHEQLMLALYLAGRSAEALRTYVRARSIMIDEVGVEPGPALRAIQQAILAGWRPANRPACWLHCP